MPLGFLSPNLCHCPPKWGFLHSQIKVRAGLCIAAKILIPAMHRHMLQHAYCILWVLTCYTLEAAGYATSGAMQLWQLTLQLCQYPSQAQIFDLRHLSEPLTSSANTRLKHRFLTSDTCQSPSQAVPIPVSSTDFWPQTSVRAPHKQ